MNEQAMEAVKERIQLGHKRDQIIAELQTAGYPIEDATSLYGEVMRKEVGLDKITITAPTQTPTMPTEAESISFSKETVVDTDEYKFVNKEDVDNSDKKTTLISDISYNRSPKKNWLPAIIIASVVLLTSVGISFAAMSGGFEKVNDFVSSFFETAPYVTESEMMEGLFLKSQSLTAYGFNGNFEYYLEPRLAGTPTLKNIPKENLDEFASLYSGEDLVEGNLLFNLSGIVDFRDEKNPEFDISGSANVSMEPIMFNIAGSARLAEGNLYGRIDDFPVNFGMMLPEDFPLDKWILFYKADSEFMLPTNPLFPVVPEQIISTMSSPLARVYYKEMFRLFEQGNHVAVDTKNYVNNQLAGVATAFGLNTTNMSEEDRKILERSVQLLKEYPPVSFVGEPQEFEENGETFYRYAVDLNFDNIRAYSLKLISESEAITGETLPTTQKELDNELLPMRSFVEEFNRLTDMDFTFREDGSIVGSTLSGVLAVDDPRIKSQLRFKSSFSLTTQNDATDIQIPTDLHPDTFEDIMEKQMEGLMLSAYPNDTVESSMENIRFYAELEYNDYDSYKTVCDNELTAFGLENIATTYGLDDVQINSISNTDSITCNSSNEAYAVLVPLSTGEAWCIDSTGFSGEVSPSSLKSAKDFSCK